MMISLLMVGLFTVGYVLIALEHKIGINKAATALLVAVVCWVLNFVRVFPHDDMMIQRLSEHLADISQVVIFVLGTMTVVELIDVHRGFKFIADFIKAKNKRQLLWIVAFLTFFVSTFLANMTTTVVMISLLRRLVEDRKERMLFASMIIIASNAGGAWTPIGDTTTTMLWIGGQVSTWGIMKQLFIPSMVSMIIPLVYFTFLIKKEGVVIPPQQEDTPAIYGAKRVLILGIASMLCVPVLTSLTNIPPYMGILMTLAMMWGLTDLINQERHYLRVPHVLTKVDISSVLFFLGILLMIASLETAGLLKSLAVWMDMTFKNKDIIVAVLGFVSAVIDNIPLTAAAMGMYDLQTYPMDSRIWEMLAYCVGTGGSILIIGSASGVVAMAMEKISFSWYLKRVTIPTSLGYLAGIAVFLILH